MNIYRWENSTRVVEIAAKTLQQARFKADEKLAEEAHDLARNNQPGSVRQCSRAGLAEDCVKTWLKH